MEYKVLQKQILIDQEYKIVPIRYEDRIVIMNWRNDQIDILRQNEKLTEEQQNKYFKEIIIPDFELDYPKQLLFSFLKNDQLIGYGGLVHINWKDKRGEVSFLLETSRNSSVEIFKSEFRIFLSLIKEVAFSMLSFNKITTEAYDLRPHLIEVLEENEFINEGTLTSQYQINGRFKDALLHACFNKNFGLKFRYASHQDLSIIYDWVNEKAVRENSFSNKQITIEEHTIWFLKKLNNPDDLFLIFSKEEDVGYVRFDKKDSHFVISVLISNKSRGSGLGSVLINKGMKEIRKKTDSPIYAYIKVGNEASIKSFVKSGFRFEKDLEINDEPAKLYVQKN